MQILFDQGTPAPLRAFLSGHDVVTAFECGWSSLTNGDLLSAAESKAFDVLITTDRNLKYQQNFTGRNIAILVLSSTNWPRIRPQVARVRDALASLEAGGFIEVEIL